jgi:hypothetical protein
MPIDSTFPSFKVPTEDIFNFLFARKDREYPDDKGKIQSVVSTEPRQLGHVHVTQYTNLHAL